MTRPRLAAAAVAVAALVLSGSAGAGPRGQWTHLPGTTVNFAVPGLARTSDGVLHAVYVRANGTKSDLVHVAVSRAGKVGNDSVALGGWATMSETGLVRMPDGSLRVFFGGIHSTAPGDPNDAMNTATAPASGGPWSLQTGHAAQSTWAYATTYAAAALAKDGTPISAWAGTLGIGFHYGTSPSQADGSMAPNGCCLYSAAVGVDSVSGQAWLGFASNESASPGFFANAIGPGGLQGGRRLAPGSVSGKSFNQPVGPTPITGRIGAPGVYLAYGQGYPTSKTLALWRVDTDKPQIVLTADGMRHTAVAAAPDGRLWLVWDRNDRIYATRTNRAATRTGPPSILPAPGSRSVYELAGEGSAGPLDLFANDGTGLWHQQVWPRLSLTASVRKARAGRTITFRVLDAGDPVAGASVKAGGKTLKTGANGTATLKQARTARVKAAASKAGYVSAAATVR